MHQAPLGKLLRIDLRSVWKNDASDFAPWVAENIDLIGEALGLDLAVVSHHRGLADSSVDVIAQDRTRDRRVLIESRLEETDHAHLGQLITHAASLQASVVVWVSREMRDDHRQAIAWLNQGVNGASEYFGVVVEVLQIDNSRPAPNLRVVASPANWTRSLHRASEKYAPAEPAPAPVANAPVANAPVVPAAQSAPASMPSVPPAVHVHSEPSPFPAAPSFPAPAWVAAAPAAAPAPLASVTETEAASAPVSSADTNSINVLYRHFFQRLLEELYDVPGFTGARRAEPQSWYAFKSPTRGFQYVASFDQYGRVWAELYIDFGDRAQNVAAFEALHFEKRALEQAFGEPLDWDFGQGRRACRIAASRPGKINDSAEALDEYRRWAAGHLVRLHTIFSSHLPAAAALAEEALDEPSSHKSPGRIGIEMLLPKSYSGTGTA
jgi:hypothetical protein